MSDVGYMNIARGLVAYTALQRLVRVCARVRVCACACACASARVLVGVRVRVREGLLRARRCGMPGSRGSL